MGKKFKSDGSTADEKIGRNDDDDDGDVDNDDDEIWLPPKKLIDIRIFKGQSRTRLILKLLFGWLNELNEAAKN